MVNPFNVKSEFNKIVSNKYKVINSKITDEEKLIARSLFEYMECMLDKNYYCEELLEQSDYDSDSDFGDKRSLESDSDYEIEQNEKSKYIYEQRIKIAKYAKLPNGKFRKFSSIQKNFRKLNSIQEVHRIVEDVDKGGNKWDKYKQIEEFVYLKYKSARYKKLPVHDINLKKWAIERSREVNIEFKASSAWINKFKKKYRIRSKKITRFVSFNSGILLNF
jgi:hypothetical protein